MSPGQVCVNLCLKLGLQLAGIFPFLCTPRAATPRDQECIPRAGRHHALLYSPRIRGKGWKKPGPASQLLVKDTTYDGMLAEVKPKREIATPPPFSVHVCLGYTFMFTCAQRPENDLWCHSLGTAYLVLFYTCECSANSMPVHHIYV